MSKNDFSIFRYSTILALTRAGVTTFEELESMTNAEIALIRGIGKRGYDEIMEKLGRCSDGTKTERRIPESN